MLAFPTALIALLAAGAPVPAHEAAHADALLSETLIEGQAQQAIPALEQSVEAEPEDPALLINLGIAHAQSGATNEARSMFERALVSSQPVELETADGKAVDSRRLARKAMRMLERGEFAPTLSRRD